MEPMHFSYI